MIDAAVVTAGSRRSGVGPLTGWPLAVLRLVVAGILLLSLIILGVALPVGWEAAGSAAAAAAPALGGWAPWLTLYPVLMIALQVVLMVLYAGVAILLFWRGSNDWLVALTAVGLITYLVYIAPMVDALVARGGAWYVTAGAVEVVGAVCALAFFYLFPTGAFVPAWSRWLLGLLVIYHLLGLAWPDTVFNIRRPFDNPLVNVVFINIYWYTSVVAQVYRYRRFSDRLQRQQSKWVIGGLALGVSGYLFYGAGRQVVAHIPTTVPWLAVYDLFGVPLFLCSILFVPIAFAFSILRHRLWDIDLLLRRTLVYGALTATLLLIYGLLAVLLQQVIAAVTGQRSDVAVVGSTLVIILLFQPLRSRFQRAIDRRFDRRPYDAGLTLSRFGAATRDEVDLDTLCARLTEVVAETMQPTRARLWLRPTGREDRPPAPPRRQ